MVKGTTKGNSTTDLLVPDDCQPIGAGTTGIRFAYIRPYLKYGKDAKESVIDFLKSIDFFEWQEQIWDCEKKALYGIAKLRCRFPGIPAGLAIGDPKYAPFMGKGKHAIIILWYLNGGKDYSFVYFDPDKNVNREIEPEEFTPNVIVPFPPYRPDVGENLKEILPAMNYIKSASLVLDEGAHRFDKSVEIKDYLKNKTYEKTYEPCRAPADDATKADFDNFRRKSSEDITFWAYIHARRYFLKDADAAKKIQCAIGVSLGIATIDGKKKPHAVIVIWERADELVYWDVARDLGDKIIFTPRIIIA
jgi:hypothetical protein